MSSRIRTVSTNQAAEPRGHYSQAVVHQGIIYVADQLPIPPQVAADADPPPPGSIEQQARQTFENVLAIVRAAGGSASSLLRVNIYVSDIEHWPVVNQVYGEVIGDSRPARGVIPTGDLHYGYNVAAEAIAAVE